MKARTKTAYKLFRIRRDGTLGSLFINRADVLPLDKWLTAELHPTEGFAVRPGWHATYRPIAPHLSSKGRRWFRVKLRGVTKHVRPAAQGGVWFTAKAMKIEKDVDKRRAF